MRSEKNEYSIWYTPKKIRKSNKERKNAMKHFSTILLMLFIFLSLAQAQHKPESGLLIFNVGFTQASPEDTDNNLNGNTFSLSYEKSNYQGNLAGGVSIAYSTTSADSITASGQIP